MKNIKTFLFVLTLTLLNTSVNSSFQLSLLQKLNLELKEKNLMLSPMSVFNILSLLANGAKGDTAKELLEMLLDSSQKEGENIDMLAILNSDNKEILNLLSGFESIEIANGVFSKFSPNKSFLEMAEKYLATAEQLESKEQINNWVKEKTHGKIPEIIKELNGITSLILLNAIYFKNKWREPFEEFDTYDDYFYNFNKESSKKKINMMHQTTKFGYYGDTEIQIIELPYQKDFMSTLVILPKDDVDMDEFIKNLTDEKYNNYILRLKKQKVKLTLPKFELGFGASLKEALQNLGMVLSFEEGHPDFTGIKPEKSLYVDDVVHKVFLNVTETGTEAAAATAVMANDGISFDPDDTVVEMNVNKPFVFIVRNEDLPKNHDVLFLAKVEEIENK